MPELRFHLQTENSGLRYPLDSWANRSSSPVPTFTLAHSVRYLGRLLTRRCLTMAHATPLRQIPRGFPLNAPGGFRYDPRILGGHLPRILRFSPYNLPGS